MRPTGHRWRTLKARFKADSRGRRAVCHRCRQAIDYDAPGQHPESFEADHYHPVATHPHLAYAYANLRPSHSKCNRSRGAKAAEQAWVQPDW
jgi:5-methylcytosine-specific restriction endonuclease McrA